MCGLRNAVGLWSRLMTTSLQTTATTLVKSIGATVEVSLTTFQTASRRGFERFESFAVPGTWYQEDLVVSDIAN